MLVGGTDSWIGQPQSKVELFPPPSSDSCSIPDLPEPRALHTLSLLPGGRLVVCGGSTEIDGDDRFDSCISWVAGQNSWTHMHTLRQVKDKINLASRDSYYHSHDCLSVSMYANESAGYPLILEGTYKWQRLHNFLSVRHEQTTWPGFQPPSLTRLSCSGATIRTGKLWILCQVCS